jgi:hypothetical protein
MEAASVIENRVNDSVSGSFVSMSNSDVGNVEAFHEMLTGDDNGAGLSAVAMMSTIAQKASAKKIVTHDFMMDIIEKYSSRAIAIALGEAFTEGALGSATEGKDENELTLTIDEAVEKAFHKIAKEARQVYAALSTLGIVNEAKQAKLDSEIEKRDKATGVKRFVVALHAELANEVKGRGF